MSETKSKISCLDLVRLIAAATVVMNHCFIEENGFMNHFGSEMLARWSVGFFFMISGFFMKKGFKDIVKYCVRIFILYVIWTVMYALFLGLNIWNPWDMFISLRNGIIMPFWYFPTLISCILTVWIVNYITKSPKITVVVCGLLYIVAIMGDTFIRVAPIGNFMDTYFYPVFERIVGTHDTRDGIFNGSFFISIGLLLSSLSKEGKLKITNKKKYLAISLVALFVYWAEVCLEIEYDLGNRDVLVTAPVLCTLIFVYAYNCQMDKERAVFFRSLSSAIFLIHYAFLTNIQKISPNEWVLYISTLLISAAASALLILASKKIKFLNYLY